MYNVQNLHNTALCYWWFTGECKLTNCTFAHDPNRLIPVIVHPLFKTVDCSAEIESPGSCQYKFRCHYIHPNDYIESRDSFIRVSTLDPLTHDLILYRIGIKSDTPIKGGTPSQGLH